MSLSAQIARYMSLRAENGDPIRTLPAQRILKG